MLQNTAFSLYIFYANFEISRNSCQQLVSRYDLLQILHVSISFIPNLTDKILKYEKVYCSHPNALFFQSYVVFQKRENGTSKYFS
jgi:hypothetical protein